jgi:hypothetical protein
MSNPNVPHKNTGDTLSADEANDIVDSIGTKADNVDNGFAELGDDGKVLPEQLPDYVPQTSPEQEGTVLVYTNDAVYGSTGTPETGNITVVLTSAKKGVSVLLLHNSGSAPTFGSAFKKSSNSGDYATGQLNYIDTQYIDDTHIRYSISQ